MNVKLLIAACGLGLAGALVGCGGGSEAYSPIITTGGGTGTTGNFTVTISPATQNLTQQTAQAGSKAPQTREVAENVASYTVTVTPTGGFKGTVNMSSTVAGGFTQHLQKPTLTLDGQHAATDILTVSIPAVGPPPSAGRSTNDFTPGNYAVSVTGTSGDLTHSASAELRFIQDGGFTLAVAPPTQTIRDGSNQNVKTTRGTFQDTATYTVTVTPQPSFVGTVDLLQTGLSPNDFITNFTPAHLTFTKNGQPQTATFTVRTNGFLDRNETDTFTIEGTGPFGTRAASAQVQVTSIDKVSSIKR